MFGSGLKLWSEVKQFLGFTIFTGVEACFGSGLKLWSEAGSGKREALVLGVTWFLTFPAYMSVSARWFVAVPGVVEAKADIFGCFCCRSVVVRLAGGNGG